MEEDGPAVGGNNHTLGSCQWPVAVVYLTMKRVGVQMLAPFVMLFLEDGSTNLRSVNLYYEAPDTVRVLVCRACELWQFAKLAASRTATPFEGLNDQVLWQPPLGALLLRLAAFLRTKRRRFGLASKCNYGIKTGRLCIVLLETIVNCATCAAKASIRLSNRNWVCTRTVGFRADVIEQFPNRYRTMMQRGDRLFLDLELVTGSFPVLPTHPEVQETWVPTKRRFTGRVYIDGSAQFPAVPFLR